MMNNIFIFLIFCFGAIVGSFLNVVILRLPKGEKLTGRSRCPHCGRVLTAMELVPIFSYVFLGGRCRVCKTKISSRYFIIEAATGLLFAWALGVFNPASLSQTIILAKILFVLSVLVVVFVVDLENYIILDSVIGVGAAGVLVFNFVIDVIFKVQFWNWHNQLFGGVLAALICPLPLLLAWLIPPRGTWMGFGDVKLAVFLGMALPWPLWPVGFLAAVFLGGLWGLVLLASGAAGLKSKVPFGTFLSLGTFLALLYGQAILHWYLSWLGFYG